ncbi:MAG: porin family protein [Marinifilaceae bacterium]
MKKLQILLVIGLLSISSTSLFAQKIGIKGGMNISKIQSEDNMETYGSNRNNKLGLNIGISTEFSLNKKFAIESGMIFDSKGFKVESQTFFGGNMTAVNTLNLYYIDIPINAKYTIFDSSIKAFITAGPYIGIGLWGKNIVKVELEEKTESVEKDIEWGEDDNPNRLDYGLNIGLGAEYKSFIFNVNYSYGLADLSPNPSNGLDVTNRVFSLSFGYIIKIF